jgi:hypothetical protein
LKADIPAEHIRSLSGNYHRPLWHRIAAIEKVSSGIVFEGHQIKVVSGAKVAILEALGTGVT